ncbi:MAG: class I tRNA ligase family protein, partial [Candidatus Marinimicrobia bacterium]|nr:class I tRNA ligase family protein [Candidatus Neomarinimicrobiota bacterium]
PFKTVLGHALVKDAAGKDMHKSDGNTIWFDEAAEKMGVDVMRWMYARQNPEQNLRFGYDRADDVRKQLLTLWNSYSFFVTYAALDKFDPRSATVAWKDRPEIDRWLASKTEQLVDATREAYESFAPHKVVSAIELYLEALSNWYIRRNRRRFWKSANDADKRAAYVTLHEALVTLVKIMAPVTPFVSEAIYQNLVARHDPDAPPSVHLCEFPATQPGRVDEALMGDIDILVEVVSLGRAARNQAGLKIRQPLSEVAVTGPPELMAAVEKYESQLLEELNIKRLRTDLARPELVAYDVQLNLPVLGPKLGPAMSAVRSAVEAMDSDELVARVQQGKTVAIHAGDAVYDLEPGELLLIESGIEPWSAATSRDIIVGVNCELTVDLRDEGLVRDLIRQVQNMRKEADLNVEERIRVGISSGSEMERSLNRHGDYFLAEVLGTELTASLEHPAHEKVVHLNGVEVQIHIAPA